MPYKINQSIFETKDNCILVNGKSIDCPINVLQAITLLLESKNNVVTKESIMKAIWGEIIVSDDSLFKVIQGVRKIFKKAHLNGALVNIYGTGYKIKPDILFVDQTIDEKPKTNPKFGKISYTFFIIIALALVIYYLVDNHKKQPLINPTTYQKLKKLGQTEAPELFVLLNKNYAQHNLPFEDEIQIAYLKALGYYKQGDYTNSIQQLKFAIELTENNQAILASADAHTLLANIYVYQSKYEEKWQHLDSAEKIYTQLSNDKGLSAVSLARARYFMAVDDFDQSFKTFEQLLNKSKRNNDVKTQIEVYYNTSYMRQLTGELDKAKQELKHMLDLSLEFGDGENIAKAYASLSSLNKLEGHFIEALKQAELAIRYAIDQNDTNRFQQCFSSLYTILNELGHQKLAEDYLNIAIDFQKSRNSKGRLTQAELNLGIIYLQKQNYIKSQQIFENLLSFQSSPIDQLETKAWLALSRYFQKDNIKTYSLSHEVFNASEATQRSKLVAGIGLMLSNFELERYVDLENIFTQLAEIDKDKWLIEKTFFIDMVLYIFNNKDEARYKKYVLEKQKHSQYLDNLKLETQPEESFLTSLDSYIKTITIP